MGVITPQGSQLNQHVPSRQADIGQPIEHALDAARIMTRVRRQQPQPHESIERRFTDQDALPLGASMGEGLGTASGGRVPFALAD
jgi:hypothetical protein